MAKLDSLEKQMQDSMRALLIEQNKEAAAKLKDELKAAKDAQDALIADATKLKDVNAATKSEGQGLWAALNRIATKGREEGIKPYLIVSLIESELGNTEEIDKRARATVAAYRGTIGAMLNAQSNMEAWNEARKARGVEANKQDADLGYATIRKIVSAVTKGNERLEFENALTAFNQAIRERAKNSPANKEKGTPAYVQVSYKELTENLTQFIEMLPERKVKDANASTQRTRAELDAADAVGDLPKVANA